MTTHDVLQDTGAEGYLFISLKFARRVLKLLRPRRITAFQPYPVGGYDRKSQQLVDVALQAAFRIDGRTELDAPMMVLDMHHDMIVGLKWYEHHEVNLIPHQRRLEFPPTWGPGPLPTDIPMDEDGHVLRNAAWDEDIRRRDAAMYLEDQRPAAGKASKPKTILKSPTKFVSFTADPPTYIPPIVEPSDDDDDASPDSVADDLSCDGSDTSSDTDEVPGVCDVETRHSLPDAEEEDVNGMSDWVRPYSLWNARRSTENSAVPTS